MENKAKFVTRHVSIEFLNLTLLVKIKKKVDVKYYTFGQRFVFLFLARNASI